MNVNESSLPTRFKVGIFSLLGLFLVGAITVFVDDKPFWWRGCQYVEINVEDATGLKNKSPVRSLGLQIGYIRSVGLTETHVTLGICITAPVEVLPSTRAYIRGEGFLGDKFVELKPVKYLEKGASALSIEKHFTKIGRMGALLILDTLTTEAKAAPGDRKIPVGDTSQDVQQLVDQVNSLVSELNELTVNMKKSIDPNEVRNTMRQLTLTLERAAKTLSPEGGLTTTAQRALAKLESAIEKFEDIMTRINQGEGSIGRLINDEAFAEEILEAIRNVNRLLSKVGGMRFVVDLGAQRIPAYDATRSWFTLSIWPRKDRYYRLGLGVDPRGKVTTKQTTTTVNGLSTTVETREVEQGGLVLTGMLGKVFFDRLDLSVGVLHGDGTAVVKVYLGEKGDEDRLSLSSEVYARSRSADVDSKIDSRLFVRYFPSKSPYLQTLYFQGGLDGIRKVNGDIPYSFGGGIEFDDNDIKILFSFL